MAAAELHQSVSARRIGLLMDTGGETLRQSAIAEFIQVFHRGCSHRVRRRSEFGEQSQGFRRLFRVQTVQGVTHMNDHIVTDCDLIQQGGGDGFADTAHIHDSMFFFNNFNDSIDDARELGAFARRVVSKINLIEYNPIDGAEFQKTTEHKTNAFMAELWRLGLVVNLRRSRGKDIDAACGQLANKSVV